MWAIGTVLLRKWKPPIPQNTLSGWMMLARLAAARDRRAVLRRRIRRRISCTCRATAWFAILYNIFLAGTLAHWAWFTLARTLPVAVSSLSSLPVPVVGVFAGMIVLGERPGPAEWIALGAGRVAALVAVLWPGRGGEARRQARPRRDRTTRAD